MAGTSMSGVADGRTGERSAPATSRAALAARRGYVWWLARLGWAACVLFSVYVFVATNPSRIRQMQDLALLHGPQLSALGLSRDFLPAFMLALDTATFIVFALVGLLIFARKSSEYAALFASLALITGAIPLTRPSDSLFFVNLQLRLPILLLYAVGTTSLLLFAFIFPDGHFAPRWMIWPALVSTGFGAAGHAIEAFSPGSLGWPPVLAPLAAPAVALAVAAQVYRYRRASTPAQQQQTKWVVFGIACAADGLLMFLLLRMFWMPNMAAPSSELLLVLLLGVPILYLSMMLIPLSIGISILRRRLWDIDLIIRRGLVYGILTALLAGLFAATVTVGQKVFLSITGESSELTTVLAALLVFALFTPMKDYVQHRIDRRFDAESFASAHLKLLVNQVRARVSPVDPYQVARRLTDQAIVAFGAKGGAAYWEQQGKMRLIYHTGDWDGNAQLSAFLQSSEQAPRLGTIALGPRCRGKDYSEEDAAVLTNAAAELARAIEQDRQDAGDSAGSREEETHG